MDISKLESRLNLIIQFIAFCVGWFVGSSEGLEFVANNKNEFVAKMSIFIFFPYLIKEIVITKNVRKEEIGNKLEVMGLAIRRTIMIILMSAFIFWVFEFKYIIDCAILSIYSAIMVGSFFEVSRLYRAVFFKGDR